MVDIGPIQAANGMTPVTGPRLEAIKPGSSIPNGLPVDRVEISPIARLMSEVSALPDIRAERVAQVRAEIQAGTYITPEKLDIAIGRLLEDIQA
jgi:negative regulator of flagellin synthesis FlgM